MKFSFLSSAAAALIFAVSFDRAEAFSPSSMILRKNNINANHHHHHHHRTKDTRLRYEREEGSDSPVDALTALARTERWISETLQHAQTPNGNPYSRKEVSFAAETHTADLALVIAGIWRRLHQARVLGEKHGQQQVELEEQLGNDYAANTMRQTSVVVLPNCPTLENFQVFDALFQQILKARRQARDYITERTLDRRDDELHGDVEKEWSVSVNCNHLHPQYGKKTPEEELAELKQEEADQEVDLNYQEYQRKRVLAYQSPYPTFVLEVRSTPPPDFSVAPPPPPTPTSTSSSNDEGVTAEDVARLEALFGKSAHTASSDSSTNKSGEDDFYSAIGSTIGGEVSAVTPMKLAQTWMTQNDPALIETDATNFEPVVAAFTENASIIDVDEAYEFVFSNIAMLLAQAQNRQYLVLSQFLPHAATSLERFAEHAQAMCQCFSDSNQEELATIRVETFHPEHVDASKRSPVPVLVLSSSKSA